MFDPRLSRQIGVVGGIDDAVVVVVAGERVRWRRDHAQHALGIEQRRVPRERRVEIRECQHFERARRGAGPVEHVERRAQRGHVAAEQIDFQQAAQCRRRR